MSLWARYIPFLCLILFVVIFGGQMLTYRRAETRVSLGIASYDQGAYKKSESQMRGALRLNPNNADACYYLGLCLLHEGNIPEAKQQFETARVIARGGKFMTRNEPLAEEAATALNRINKP